MKKRSYMAIIPATLLSSLALVGCTIIALEVYSQQFGRVEGFRPGEFYTVFTWDNIDRDRYPRREVRFNSGGNSLQGFIYGMENDRGLIVISHGLGGSADFYLAIIMHFVDRGWRVFAFNNTGTAGSEGESVRGLTQSVIDLDAALTFIARSDSLFDNLPVMLIGHSWGGFAVCAVLNLDHNVRAAVSAAGFNNGRDVFEEQGTDVAGGFFHLLTPQLRTIERQLFGDTARLTAVDGINRSGIPVMIVQCLDDDLIRADTTSIYAHRGRITNPNVEFFVREGIGHEFIFSSPGQREYMEWVASSWQEYRDRHENASPFQWAEEVGFCRVRANELDTELMDRIEAFFDNAR